MEIDTLYKRRPAYEYAVHTENVFNLILIEYLY